MYIYTHTYTQYRNISLFSISIALDAMRCDQDITLGLPTEPQTRKHAKRTNLCMTGTST